MWKEAKGTKRSLQLSEAESSSTAKKRGHVRADPKRGEKLEQTLFAEFKDNAIKQITDALEVNVDIEDLKKVLADLETKLADSMPRGVITRAEAHDPDVRTTEIRNFLGNRGKPANELWKVYIQDKFDSLVLLSTQEKGKGRALDTEVTPTSAPSSSAASIISVGTDVESAIGTGLLKITTQSIQY
jgi:hypothetical protein